MMAKDKARAERLKKIDKLTKKHYLLSKKFEEIRQEYLAVCEELERTKLKYIGENE